MDLTIYSFFFFQFYRVSSPGFQPEPRQSNLGYTRPSIALPVNISQPPTWHKIWMSSARLTLLLTPHMQQIRPVSESVSAYAPGTNASSTSLYSSSKTVCGLVEKASITSWQKTNFSLMNSPEWLIDQSGVLQKYNAWSSH
jgi:hypothetical protein